MHACLIMFKIRVSQVLAYLLIFLVGNTSVNSQQGTLAGFRNAYIFHHSSSTLSLPSGSFIIRILAVGGGGGGCYGVNPGRGKSGEVIVHIITKNLQQIQNNFTVIVGKGSSEALRNQAGLPTADHEARSQIFGFTARGGATCVGKGFSRPNRFKHFFISLISNGSPGNDSRGLTRVPGGMGGILINNTGPTAERGGEEHSSRGGHGYGAGAGSGGKFRVKDQSGSFVDYISRGGRGAPGVVYIEVVPKVCRKPSRVMFALDASASLDYQTKSVSNLIKDFFSLSQDLTKASVMTYGSKSVIQISFEQTVNMKTFLAAINLGITNSPHIPSDKVNFKNMFSRAMKSFQETNETYEKYTNDTKTLVIFTNQTVIKQTNEEKRLKSALRTMGIQIFVVGLARTTSPSREELQKLTFEDEYVFVERDNNKMDVKDGPMVIEIANMICRETRHDNHQISATSSPTRKKTSVRDVTQEYDFILNYDINNSDPSNETEVKRVLSMADGVIRNSYKLPNSTKIAPGLKVLQFLEEYGLNMATKLQLNHNQNRSYKYFEEGNIGMTLLSFKISSVEDIVLPRSSPIADDAIISLPKEAFGGSDRGHVSWLTLNPVVSMKLENNSLVASKIASINIQPKANHKFTKPVEITFSIKKHQIDLKKQDHRKTTCEFWDTNKQSPLHPHGAWSSKGCHVVAGNSTSVACQCNHLTSFAILTRIVPRENSMIEHEKYLTIITYVGCSLSMLGCILTIVIHSCLPSLRTERTFIHLNLVAAILIAQSLFFVAASIRGPKSLCFAVAVGLYLFYLSVFTWMLVEGLHIYCLVIRVFHSGHERKRLYALIGWVLPLVITIICAAAFRENFIAHNICWLSTDTGSIWSFVGPALLIIAINLVILLLVLRATAIVMVKDEAQNSSNKSLVRACITLLPILGLTWLFGVLAMNNKTIVFEYLFCAFNSIQGLLIFFFYCIGSSEVRRECKRKLHNYETKRSLRSSSTGYKPQKQNNGSAKQTKTGELITCQPEANDDTRL